MRQAPLTLREYARRRGVAHSTIVRQTQSGRIPTTDDGRIDPEAADAALAGHKRARAERSSETLSAAQRRKVAARVGLLMDALEARRRSLLPPDEVTLTWRLLTEHIATALCELARDVAPRVAGRPATDAYAVLDAAVYETLLALSETEVVTVDERAEEKPVELAKLTALQLARLKADVEAERLELERAARRGELWSAETVSDQGQVKCSNVRAHVLALPTKTAPLLELTPDPAAAEALLLREIAEAVEELELYGVEPLALLPDWAKARLAEAGGDAA